MVIGRFKTQCIKEDNTKRHQKIKAMVKEYLNSAEFETDFNIEINNYIARGEEVPPDRQIREMKSVIRGIGGKCSVRKTGIAGTK